DLFGNVLEELGTRLDRVVINELRETTYYATLVLTHHGDTSQVSSRPSDAIALAVRAGCPIYAEEDVLEEAGFVEEVETVEESPDAVVEEFRQFIDNVSPDDFAS
ncbi:MAG: bifunctional nuclease family protein, partial [Acidimicrobiales bacterium]